MKAGVDLGSTSLKVVYDDGGLKFLSSHEISVDDIVRSMKTAGVTEVKAAGIGDGSILSDFKVKRNRWDPVANEVKLQALGVKKFLKMQGKSLDKFLLVSVGSGTSYTLVEGGKIEYLDFMGNSSGGGSIKGFFEYSGIEDYQEGVKMAQGGRSPDTLLKYKMAKVKPLHPKYKLLGGLFVSNMGEANKDTKLEDMLAGVITEKAVLTARDIGLLEEIPKYAGIKNIVFIGGAVTHNDLFRKLVTKYTKGVGLLKRKLKKPIFPDNAQFALALGAYLS